MNSLHTPSARPRLLFLNRSYWPDVEATGQLLTELCEDLASDFDVTVLAGQPNHDPQGRNYRVQGVQCHHGVHVRRVWNSRLPKSSLAGKAMNLLTYLVLAWGAALRLGRPAAVVVETDPPLLCVVGAFLQRWFGCKLIVYLQDIYPDVAVALGKLPGGWWTRWLRRWFFGIYRRADRVVVLSDDMRSLLIASGVDPRRIVCIPNWVDTSRIYPIKTDNRFRQRHSMDGQFVVMYSGNLGLCQRIDDLLAAATQLRSRRDIRFVLVGDGVSKRRLQALACEQELTNVQFLPYQRQDELAESLSAADLHVVPVDPRVTQYLMPSKLYGVLASGTPLVAVAPADCDLARVTREGGVGFVVSPGDPAGLADTVRWCADHRDQLAPMGEAGWRLARDKYERRTSTGSFSRLLAELLGMQLRPTDPATAVSPPQTSAIGALSD